MTYELKPLSAVEIAALDAPLPIPSSEAEAREITLRVTLDEYKRLLATLASWQTQVAAALGVTTAEEALTAVQGIPDGLRTVLQDHWLVDIICDHEAKTDQAVCNCAVEALPVCPSVGLAVAAWIEHVLTKAAPWLPREEPTHD